MHDLLRGQVAHAPSDLLAHHELLLLGKGVAVVRLLAQHVDQRACPSHIAKVNY